MTAVSQDWRTDVMRGRADRCTDSRDLKVGTGAAALIVHFALANCGAEFAHTCSVKAALIDCGKLR